MEADLTFFEMVKDITVPEGRALSQAHLLFGSFFFVHKSEAKRGDASAFEFLHNTFGEFLTADFILHWAIKEVLALVTLRSQETLLSDLQKKLNSPDGLARQWFASLVYTPLFTRPVVLEMMHEWSGHLLDSRSMSRDAFAEYLDTILRNQIERLISKRAMPSIMMSETVDEKFRARFGDYPLVGHIAVYSVNLLLLRLIVSQSPFVMDEGAIKSYEDGARPWDRLVHIWRSWFSLEALHGLSAVIESVRKRDIIEVRAKPTMQVPEARGRLDVLLNVSVAVADDLTAAVSGLAQSEMASSQILETQDIALRLTSERIEASFQIAVRELQEAVRRSPPELIGVAELVHRASNAIQIALRERPRDDAERVALLFAAGVRTHLAARRNEEGGGPSFDDVRSRHFQQEKWPAVDMRFLSQLMEKSPEAALIWVKAAKLLVGGRAFRGPEAEELFERFAHGGPPAWELIRESPTSLVAWVGVLRELGLHAWWRRGPRGPFERFFHPRMMMDLIDQSPETALSFLQALHELGGDAERFWRHMEPEVTQRLLDPRYLLVLAERSPEAAASLARLLREWGDGLFREVDPERAQRVVREFIERAVETPFLFELAERSPETALEIVRVVRMLGDREAIPELMPPGYLERLYDWRNLPHFLERSPGAAVVMVQLLHELGGDAERFWRHMKPEIVQRLLDPRYLLALAERIPDAATSLARLLCEWGDGRVLRETDPERTHQVVREFIERIVETPYLFELMERSPGAAVEVMRLVLSLGGRDSIREQMHPRFLERLSDRRFLLRLAERSPEAAVAMVKLFRELAGDSRRMWRRLRPHASEQLFDPSYLLELSERSPESALILTDIWGEMKSDDRDMRGPFGPMWEPTHVESVLAEWLARPTRDPRGFAAALFLARQVRCSPDPLRRLADAVALAVDDESLSLVLPLAVCDDLRWLASLEEAKEVRDALLRAIPGVLPPRGPN